MKQWRRSLAALLSAAMLLPGTTALAAGKENTVWFYEDFNTYPTNASQTSVTVENTTPYVKPIATTNKALELKTGFSKSKITANWTGTADEMVLAFDLKMTGKVTAMEASALNASGVEAPLFTVDSDGMMKTYDGKEFAGVPINVTRKVQVLMDVKNGTYSIYLEGRCFIADWVMKRDKFIPSGVRLTLVPGETEEGAVYLDNLRAYPGDNVRRNFPNSVYNTETIDIVDIPEDVGNALLADNDFEEDTVSKATRGFYPNAKDNILELRKDGQSQYLYMEKNTDEDTHLDRNISVDMTYVMMQMDVKMDKFGAAFYPFLIRDSVSNDGNVDDYFGTVNATGELKLRDGTLVKKLTRGTWFNLAVGYNFGRKTFDVYIDREKVISNHKMQAENVNCISMIRTWIYPDSSMAAIGIDNYKVYEGKELIDNFDAEPKSVMSGPERPEAFLQGRTAIDVNSGSVFVGEKLPAYEKAEEKDGDYYVSWETAELLFGQKPVCPDRVNGKVALQAFAQKVGKKVYNNGNGLLVFSENEFTVDPVLMKEVEGYMFFQRPSAEIIQADFMKKTNQGKMHPRVMATADDFKYIRERIATDQTLASWHRKVIAQADTYLQAKVDVYDIADGYRLLPVSRSVKEKMMYWGYAYQTTGDTAYFDKAWEVLDSVIHFPDWNPAHYIDCAEMMYGVAVAYDWMYDAFTPEQRKALEDAILNMGVTLSWQAYYGRLTTGGVAGASAAFVTEGTNFNVVSNAGTMVAALAIADVYPDICFDTISQAVQSLEYVLPAFAPDGGWEEGPNYWNYTIAYLAKLLSALDTAVGNDYGIPEYPGLSKTAYYAIHLDSWQGLNNFSDTWPGGHIDTAELGYLAKKYKDPAISYNRYQNIKNYNLAPKLFDILWYDQKANEEKSQLALDHYTRGIEAVSFRETWEKSDSLFVSAHGGDTHAYHGHYDGGNFVFDLLGERWALDLTPQEYNEQIGTGLYEWYNRRAEGHNMLVINPDMEEDFYVDSDIPLIRYESKPKGGIAVYDTTEGYVRNATAAKRGIMVGDDRRSLTVRDEVELNNKDATVYWFMHTKAEIQVEGKNKAVLTLNGKQLQMEFASNAASIEISSMDAAPIPGVTPDRPERLQNTGIRKVAVKMTGTQSLYLEVKMSAVGEPAAASGMVNKPVDEWTLPEGELAGRGNSYLSSIKVDGQNLATFNPDLTTYTLGVLEGQPMPEITAVADSGVMEIAPAQSLDEVTTITAYDASKSFKTVYVIDYKELKIPADVFGMTRYVVTDFATSSIPEPLNAPVNMLDGDLTTRWSGSGVGEWALLDLGEVKPLDAVAVAYWPGSERKFSFEIQVSEDGEFYQTVYRGESSGTTDDYELFDFDRVNARYVKYVGSGNTVNLWNNLVEFAPLAEKGANES